MVLQQRLSNGSIEPDSDVTKLQELQTTIDKQVTGFLKFFFISTGILDLTFPLDIFSKTDFVFLFFELQSSEITTWQRRVSELNTRISELEETLSKTQKELLKSQDACSKLQRDLRENVAQKEDQEERIATLEKRYLNAQRESTSLHDLNEKLEQELQHKEAQLKVSFGGGFEVYNSILIESWEGLVKILPLPPNFFF